MEFMETANSEARLTHSFRRAFSFLLNEIGRGSRGGWLLIL